MIYFPSSCCFKSFFLKASKYSSALLNITFSVHPTLHDQRFQSHRTKHNMLLQSFWITIANVHRVGWLLVTFAPSTQHDGDAPLDLSQTISRDWLWKLAYLLGNAFVHQWDNRNQTVSGFLITPAAFQKNRKLCVFLLFEASGCGYNL